MADPIREKTKATGVYKIHARGCTGGKCKTAKCTPTFQATVYSHRDRKLLRQHFPTQTEAEKWRRELWTAVEQGKVRAARMPVAEAADKLLAGMKDGTILSRKRRPYEEETIEGYERDLREHIVPSLGRVKVSALDRVGSNS